MVHGDRRPLSLTYTRLRLYDVATLRRGKRGDLRGGDPSLSHAFLGHLVHDTLGSDEATDLVIELVKHVSLGFVAGIYSNSSSKVLMQGEATSGVWARRRSEDLYDFPVKPIVEVGNFDASRYLGKGFVGNRHAGKRELDFLC